LFESSSRFRLLLEHDPRFRGGRPFPKTGIHFSGSYSNARRSVRMTSLAVKSRLYSNDRAARLGGGPPAYFQRFALGVDAPSPGNSRCHHHHDGSHKIALKNARTGFDQMAEIPRAETAKESSDRDEQRDRTRPDLLRKCFSGGEIGRARGRRSNEECH